jgi:hypothetical protein
MMPRRGAVDDEIVGMINGLLITVAGDGRHYNRLGTPHTVFA